MKFLRLAFYVLIAQLVLSGCAGEGMEETSASSSEINFDAYLGTNASTRAGETNLASLKGTAFNSGFGVFARHKHADGSISDMMDNEHVTWKEDRWEYTNIQYWPDKDSVYFYAYAPHIDGVKLVKAPGENKANPTYIEFNSFYYPVDLVWAVKKREVPKSPTSASKVDFQFKHALARLAFDITVNPQLEENGAVVKVEEVKLYGKTDKEGALDVKGYLNLADERDNVFWGWSVVKNESTRAIYTWTSPDTEDGGDLKLTASQLDHTCTKIENASNSYLYVIPQEKKEAFYLQITYTVQQGTSLQTITVRKNLLDVNNPFNFEKRKTYLLHLKLSLGSTRSRSSASEDCSVTMSVSSIPE